MKSYSTQDMQNVLDDMSARTSGLEGVELRAELTKFANELSIFADGDVTMLWAGHYNQASAIAEADNNIRILNKTLANDILESVQFNEEVARSFGVDMETYINADRDSVLGKQKTEFLFDGKNGLWAQVSKRFAEETVGEVRIMTTNSSKESVLVATELEAIKQIIISGKVTKIDGFSSEDLGLF